MPPTDPGAGPAPVSARDGSGHATDGSTAVAEFGPGPAGALGTDVEDTLDLRLPDDFLAGLRGEPVASLPEEAAAPPVPGEAAGWRHAGPLAGRGDLLDRVESWGPTATSAGEFRLVPVQPERDLPLVVRWMNDPAVAAFWELAGPPQVAGEHVRAQLTGDGRSVPCLGLLDGSPMSYWEIYRADLDPLARHYPARPHDTGIHLLIGGAADRGRGLGSMLLRAVADLTLDSRPACARVIAEPDLCNIPSIAAFLTAGFRFSAEIGLPGKRAALMVRDRSLRHLL
ncbi:GNAT family N-acetyltransferase [Streptomyces sp. NPDC093094]|uniref:GNAT family N-acetyltransferase n=1 Tax=Streptomyces sp. NPDC093094 TaxID=3366026 RepID=UPI00382A2336